LQPDKQLPGLYFKELDNGRLRQSIHLDTFMAYFKQLANEKGWVQLDIEKLPEPIKGFTHRFYHVKKAKAA
jgi:hypothetical protein